MSTKTIEAIAEAALKQALEEAAEGTETVRLWDDEWEQWHIDLEAEGEVELTATAAAAYRLANELWHKAQYILTGAVEAIRLEFTEEARDNGWVDEWLRGDLTRAQLDARAQGCQHSELNPPLVEGGGRRCVKCNAWVSSKA